MKKFNTLTIAATLLLAACSKTTDRQENPPDLVPAEVAKAKTSQPAQDLLFTEPNLFPEGVVYDKFHDRFYVSSTTRGDVGIVDKEGNYTAFITNPSLVSTTGLEIDEARKLLYVANSTDGTVGIYSTVTGERQALIDLKPLSPGAAFFLNDIALDPQGNAYVTNSRAPVLYKISRDGTASVFYTDAAFATTGFGFNGIEYGSQQGGYLLVAYSVANQVVKFPIRDPGRYNVVNLDASLAGPDGLLLSKNGKDLVVVNNAGGGNGRVIQFSTENNWATATAVTTYQTGPVFPTTATLANGQVYVLYAYLNRRATGQAEFTIKRIPGIENF